MSSTTTAATAGSSTNASEIKNGFQIPKWAGKPPSGLHLDVMKEGKMIQKLMIDEKKCYFFGRNKDSCEFVIDHASCSRVHAVLIWHKHLNRSFLIDLGSTHGTFIGSIRLDPNKPQQVFIDSELKFGASTRSYIIRERPQINKHFPSILQNNNSSNNANEKTSDFNEEKQDQNNLSISILPESEAELDNLTDFHTAHNKRIAQLVDISATNTNSSSNLIGAGPVLVKKKKKNVQFNDEEDIINPEDIDPSVGRFRNMIQTVVIIPNKKKRPSQAQFQNNFQPSANFKRTKALQEAQISSKRVEEYEEANMMQESNEEHHQIESDADQSYTLYDYDDYETNNYSTIGIKKLDLAPDVDSYKPYTAPAQVEQLTLQKQQQQLHLQQINKQWDKQQQLQQQEHELEISGKKKYAKEAWPGRKAPSTNVATYHTASSPPVDTNINQPSTKIAPSSNSSSPPLSSLNPTATSPSKKTATVAPKRLLI